MRVKLALFPACHSSFLFFYLLLLSRLNQVLLLSKYLFNALYVPLEQLIFFKRPLYAVLCMFYTLTLDAELCLSLFLAVRQIF